MDKVVDALIREESIKEMQEAEKTFNSLNDEINKTVEDYNKRITALQEEGNARVAELQNSREQQRGVYNSSYQRFLNHGGTPEMLQQAAPAQPVVAEPTVAELVHTPEENVIEEESAPLEDNVIRLTEEEKEKLSSVTKPESKNTSDIPEYLKEEYKD